jgi:hypothetical protein
LQWINLGRQQRGQAREVGKVLSPFLVLFIGFLLLLVSQSWF